MQDNTADQSAQIPDDFREYEKYRETGELPAAATDEQTDELPEAAADKTATPEHATESETDEEEQEQEQNEKPGKKGRGFQKRIDQLTAKIRELEAKTAQPAAAANETPGNASPQPAAGASADGEPQSENFETYKDYVRALTKWEIGEAEKAKAATQRKNQVNADWNSKVESFKAKHTDFQDVLAAAELPLTAAMQEAIVTDENGPAIAYHLAQHPEEAKRLAGLSPVATVREIGKLAAKLETPVTPKPQAASKAPKPPTPVAGAVTAAAADIHDEQLAGDFRAWEKERNKGLQRRR